MIPDWRETDYYKGLRHWQQVLLQNPDLFLLRYFSHRITALEPFHNQLLDSVLNQVRALILYPAGHGKTTLASTLCPILELCRDPNIRVAIIAKNDTEGEGIMRAIQAELVDNTDLVRDFGPFKPEIERGEKPWALGRMEVQKRTRRDKSSTIAIFGSGAKTTLGYRTDLTVCDDVVTGDNSATPVQREKIRNWFDLCVETGPEHEHSRLVVVGTRFDPHDLYGDLIEMEDPEAGVGMWHVDQIDAIVGSVDDKQTLWPARWSWARLMKQKAKVGTLNFNKRYRNIAVDASRMVFKEPYVRGGYDKGVHYPGCLDRTHCVGDFQPDWRMIAGFDPASGSGRSAKFCAHITLALASCREHEKCIWVVDLHRDQLTLPQQIELILREHEKYGLFKTIVEANAYQIGLYDAIHGKMEERGVQYEIDKHYTNRSNKPDPELGVQSMSPWFEKGQVHIPWGDPHSQRKMQVLVDELVMYPDGRTSDTVMGFWFSWRTLMESAPKWASFNRLDTRTPDRPWFKHQRSRHVIQNPYYRPREEVA